MKPSDNLSRNFEIPEVIEKQGDIALANFCLGGMHSATPLLSV